MLSNLIEILILSIVQGITEFLPISSSAHLNIIEILFHYKSNSLIIDVALHFGSLLAIIFYFKNELLDLQNNQKILLLIIIGSIPIIITGYILYTTNYIFLLKDNLEIIAWTTLVFGILLFFADRCRFDKKISSNLNLKTILYIGFFQILALVPGVSRAGITLTAARIFKFNRVDAGKISFFMAIPALSGASLLSLKNTFQQSFEFNYLVFMAVTLSFVFSYFTVKFFLRYINKFSLNIFVIYRIIISIILFIIIYS
jgi:undecaprenyl-diphosphatase